MMRLVRYAAVVAAVLLLVGAAALVPPEGPPPRHPSLILTASAAGPVILAETPPNGALINTSTPVITVVYSNTTGRVAAAGFFLDGMNLSSAGSFNQSAFVLPLGFELRDGPHVANATVANVFGGVASVQWGFTVDTTPPILVVTAPAYPAVPVAIVNVEGTAVLASPYFAGAAPIRVTATVLPSGFRNSGFAAANGSFSVPVTLSEGANLIFVNATDRLGNLAVQLVKILSDTVPPPLVVLAPANLSISPTNLVRVSGRSEFGAFLTVNGYGVVVAPNGTWSVILALPEGVNVIQVAAADQVGNLNYAGVVVLVDSDAPVVTLVSPTYPLTNRNRVVVSGTVTDTKLYLLLVNGEAVPVATGGSFSTTVTLPEGLDPIVVVAVDVAGHTTTLRAWVRVDTTPPVVSIAFPPDGLETNGSTVLLRGTVDDPSATVLVDSQMIRPDATGHWTTTVALLPGGNTISVSAVDLAGNRAPTIVLQITYASPIPGLQNGTASDAVRIDELGAVLRFSLVGIVLLFSAVVLVVYSRLSLRIRNDRRVIAELVRRSGKGH